jgi:hypothetical protein
MKAAVIGTVERITRRPREAPGESPAAFREL